MDAVATGLERDGVGKEQCVVAKDAQSCGCGLAAVDDGGEVEGLALAQVGGRVECFDEDFGGVAVCAEWHERYFDLIGGSKIGLIERVADVLLAVGEEHEPFGAIGREEGGGELKRGADVGLRGDGCGGERSEGLLFSGKPFDERVFAVDDDGGLVTVGHVVDGLADDGFAALLRFCRDGVGDVEYEDGGELIDWLAQLDAREREDDQRDEEAAQGESPPEARNGRAARSEDGDADGERDEE